MKKVKYKDEKQGSSIVVNIDAAVAKEMSEKVKDPIIKSVVLKKDGRKASKLVVSLNKEQQYKVFALQQPNRIVLDIYRILVTKNTVTRAKDCNIPSGRMIWKVCRFRCIFWK